MLVYSGQILGHWLLCFLSVWTVYVSAGCVWTTSPNTYVDGGTHVSKTKTDLPNAVDCKAECDPANGCVAASYDADNSFRPCMIFTTPPQNRAESSADFSSRTLFEVTCVADTTTTTPATTTTTTTTVPGCVWTTSPNTYVDGGTQVSKTKADLPNAVDCKAECDPANGCVAASYDADNSFRPCMIFTTPPQHRATSSADYSSRTVFDVTCVADTTTAPATTTTTATTVPDICPLEEQSNREVTSKPDVSVVLTASLDNCKRLCKFLAECEAISYNEQAGTCIIHTSTTTSATDADYVFAKRTMCPNSTNCCFGDPVTRTKGTSTSVMSVQAKLNSCQKVCKAIRLCGFLAFADGNVCKIYKNQPMFIERQGSSYFKSCDNLSQRGSLTLQSECSSSETIRLSKLLGIWLVMLFIALV